MSERNYITFKAPCCVSIRECNVRKHIIVSLRSEKVLREIDAVRCGRGEVKKYKFYPSNDVVLAEYYISNRGNLHLKILWKPNGVDDKEAEEIIKKSIGWIEEEFEEESLEMSRKCAEEIKEIFGD